MALNLTPFDAGIQAAIGALPAPPDPKALLLIAKAIEASRPTAAVSDVLAASVSQQAILGTKGSDALTALEAARVKAIQDVQAAGQGSAAASGIAFTPGGGIAATNVQGALIEVDAEAAKRAANLSDLADSAAARQNLGLRPGVEVQPYDADLAAIAALTSAADRVPYFTGAGTAALATLTAFARSLLDDGDAATMRATLLLGAAALLGAGTAAGQVPVLDANGKLVTGVLPESVLGAVKYQGGWDASANAPTLPAPASANRGWYYIVTTAGTTSLTGPAGAITDWQVGDWAVSDGTFWEKVDSSDQVNSVAGLQGTISAANLRTALALVVGTNVQAYSANLADLSGQASTAYGRALLGLANAAALAAAAGVPGKAAGSDLRGLTDDAKFLTAKAMADAMAYTTPAWAATFIPDWSTYGFRQSLVATGNTTLGGPFVGGKDGEDVALEFAQDATGGRTLAVNTTYVKLPTGLTLTASTAANAVDLLTGYLRLVGSTLVLQVTGFLKGAR